MPPVSHVKYAFLAAIAASATLSSSVFAQRPKNPPPDDCPNDNPEYKCPTDDAVENGCVLISLDLGRTTPWTGSDSVKLKIRTTKASPSLSTPSQLKLVLGYSFMYVGSDQTAAGAPRFVFFAQSAGRTLSFQFADGSSVGVPSPGMYGESKTRLQMVDAEGWATLANPAYYDLYPGDGSVYRFSASPAAPDFGNLVHRIDPRGVLSTWEDMGVTVLRDASGNIRQVATRTRLADVQTLSDTHYSVTVYPLDAEPETDPDTGLFVLPQWNPTRVLDVSQGSSPLELLVGFQKGTGDIRQYRYVEQNGEWTLVKQSGLVDSKEIFYSANETGARRLHLIRSPEGELLRRTEMNFASTPWGWAMTNRIEGIPGDATRTTSWSFYEEGPNPGEIREKITPTGNRILYEYDDKNRVVRESMPLVEEETLYSYEPVDPSDPTLLCDTRPRCVVRKMQDVEIQRTYYVYGTNGVDVVERVGEQGAAYGGTNVLRTVTTYYPVTGAVTDGLVKSVRHEDGTIDDYAYGLTDGVWTETITHVHEQAPDIVPMRTTRSVRVFNALGQLVDSRTDLCTIGVEDLVPQADWTPIERLQYAYDVDGNEIRREDLAGRLWTAEWAGNCCGKISETDWQGITTTYAYDAEGRVVAKQAGSILTETAYDALGRATNVARRGIATADRPAATVHSSSFEYDSLGRLIEKEGEDGIRRIFAYAYRLKGGEIRSVIEAPNSDCERTMITMLDSVGRIAESRLNGVVQKTEVVSPFSTTVFTGPNGTESPVWERNSTDLFGRIVRTEKPGFGGTILFRAVERNLFGLVTSETQGWTDSNGADISIRKMTSYEYDTTNTQIRATFESRVTETTKETYRIENGAIWKEINRFDSDDPSRLGHRILITRVRKTAFGVERALDEGGSASLVSEEVTVNRLGVSVTNRVWLDRADATILNDRSVSTSTMSETDLIRSGVLIRHRTTENVETFFEYDGLGRNVGKIDGFGNLTSKKWDYFGRLANIVEPTGTAMTFRYDALGRRTSITDALGNVKTTSYDAGNRPIFQGGAQYPVLYSYDGYGRLETMTTYRDPNDSDSGDTTTWVHEDATGLVVRKIYADGNGPTYTYSPDGKLTRTTWARGAWVENVYDKWGRLVEVKHNDDSLDIIQTYDVFGRLRSSATAAATYNYTYDDVGLVTNELANIDGVEKTILREYDAFGRQTRIRIAGSAFDQTYTYDAFGRLSGIGIPDASIAYAYTSDSFDAGYTINTASNAVLTRALFRDPQRRGLILSVSNLVNGVDSDSSFDYTYDALGRPVTRNLDEFGYNARGEVARARYGTNTVADIYDFDGIGNFSSNCLGGTWTQFEANELNEYLTITDTAARILAYDLDGNLLPNGVWAYSYDSENRLAMVMSNGVVIATNIYDSMSRRIRTLSANENISRFYNGWNVILESRFTAGDENEIPFYWGKDLSGRLQGAGGVGGLLCSYENGAPHFPAYDNNGNVVGYFNGEGEKVAEYGYDVFGNFSKKVGFVAEDFIFCFSTKPIMTDRNYDFGYRVYLPKWSRWMSRDQIPIQLALNLFIYVKNMVPYSIDYLGFSRLPDVEISEHSVIDAIIRLEGIAETFFHKESAMDWKIVSQTAKKEEVEDCSCSEGKAYIVTITQTFSDKSSPADYQLGKWNRYPESSGDEQELWDFAIDLIEKHELDHIAIFDKWRSKLNHSFSKVGRACEYLDAVDSAVDALKTITDSYYLSILTGWFNENEEFQHRDESSGGRVPVLHAKMNEFLTKHPEYK